ncbi:hypothetical protein EXIGLDRAFT_802828 [Exidia glandulosa HHB12029]|uniref:Uncharacterized protein n=1 Tax=Exidia glandulosa HHB12029 TaxID=1314781 RepID=A0A165E4G1_EXIGL|nr:hypothetical protein EXIGLDRAFT_802828 [Exidia glandulosa HHB12029]
MIDPLPQYTETDSEALNVPPVPAPAPVDEPKQELPFRKPSRSERDGGLVPYPLPPAPLPAGTRRPTPHTFTYDSSLSVRLTSQAMRSDSIPIFHNEGTSVTIALRGYRRNVPIGVFNWGGACLFMRRSQVLWDSTLPRLPNGRTEIPFELHFPEICVLWDRSVEPPPSFRAPGYPYYFYYHTVKYKLLNVDAE